MKLNLYTILASLALMCFGTFSARGQSGFLNGMITAGETPLPYATIEVENFDASAITDTAGYFSLRIEPGEYVVKASYVGMIPVRQKVTVGSSDTAVVVFTMSENTQLTEVVITGTMKRSYVADSPVKIDVIRAKQLEAFIPAASASVVEGVTLINGVEEVVACGVCFTNSISINGLPGQYTAILMDGMPMYGNLASVYGLNGIPNMIIDRYEVIKGPSSTLYGSEAMAGVLNIITKDPSEAPLVQADMMATSHNEFFGNLAVAPSIKNAHGFIGLNYAYINDFDDKNEDGFGDVANLDRFSFFTKWNLERPAGKLFSVAAKVYYEDRRNGVEDYLADRNYRTLRGDSLIYGESIYTKRAELFGTYEFGFIDNLRLDFSLSTHHQDSYYGADHYIADQEIVFGNFIYNRALGKHDLTGGLSLRYQAYNDNTVATESMADSIIVDRPQNQFIPGLFLQDEWAPNDTWTILPGMRLDYYREHGLIPSPRISAKASVSDWTTLRANFGTGFKIVNLFTEDHAFVTGQREVVIEGTLDPERSISGAVNINHIFTLGRASGSIDVDAYYTYFTNKIIPDYDVPGQIVYRNAEGSAQTMGLATTANLNFSFPLALQVGFNMQKAVQTELNNSSGDTKSPIEFAPRYTALLTANYTLPKPRMTFAYTARLTGPMALPEVFDLDEDGHQLPYPRPVRSQLYSIHNLQVSLEINERISTYMGIQNIFNYIQPWSPLTGYNDPNATPGFSDQFDTAYAYGPTHGREFYLGLKLTFGD